MSSKESLNAKLKPQSKFGKFKLLLWKNYLLRKRSWILTLLEILIPVLFMTLIISLRTLADSEFLSEQITEDSIFKEADEDLLREIFCNRSLGHLTPNNRCLMSMRGGLPGDKKLFWGPPNDFTREMIDIFRRDIIFPNETLVSVETIAEMNNLVDSSYYETNNMEIAFYVGIFFNLDNNRDDDIPQHLNYDLRLQRFWFTDFIYPFVQVNGPRNNSFFNNVGSYTMDGFVLLQTIIDRAYMSMLNSQNSTDNPPIKEFSLSTMMYPYPPYTSDHGLSQLYGSALPTFIVFSLILLSPTLIKSIVFEKETGVRELVRMMGMESWLVWLGWFLYSFLPLLIVSIIISIMLTSSFGNLPPIFTYSDPSLLWFILMLYCLTAVFFCFAISCFFSKPTLATTVGVLLWILTYFIPRSFMDNEYADMSLAPKLLSCLLPNMALTWAMKVIGMFEGRGLGITWDNLGDTGNPRDQLTPGLIIMMLIIDCFLFLLITWYVDEIKPGTYGVPEPWYFPFTKVYWKKGDSKKDDKEQLLNGADVVPNAYQKFFEKEPQGMKVGIEAKGLRKEFKTLKKKIKVAVDHVDLTCYEGQCTVLLGHNGAGKTTTMSVLTGVYPPSGGNAQINGWNIRTHLKEARSQVGLCPQHNTLFNALTVEEHLLFFAMLKGSTSSLAKEQSDELLKRLQLDEKKEQFGRQLSGGMKRKLCLAIALIGGSRVVILDEPSSGLDPESRRWVWDIVQEERNHRTVLVTTHHMEEADVLGDRIAIMSEGKVVCCGSSLFLKDTFGDGYTLSVTTVPGTREQPIADILSGHLPGCSLRSKENDTFYFKIPPETNKFSDLLDQLTKEKESLGIVHLGLSLTTMEQVFLRVGKMLEDKSNAESNGDIGQHNTSITKNENNSNENLPSIKPKIERQESHTVRQYREQKLQGKRLLWNRIRSLLKKKFIYSKRKWMLLISQALIPVLVTMLCLLIDAAFSPGEYVEPGIEMNLNMFEETSSLVNYTLGGNPQDLGIEYYNLFRPPFLVDTSSNITVDLLAASEDSINKYRENHITSAQFKGLENDRINTLMMYQSIPYHSPGIGINQIDNAILRYLFPDANHTITTYNAPLPPNNAVSSDDDTSITYSALIYSTTMPIALAFLTSSYLVFPLNERTSNAKQIQVMTGTSTLLLWLTSYLWDLVSYMASALIIFICFMLFDSRGYFTSDGAPGALFLLLFLYGISSIPMAYVFSMGYKNAASGFAVLALVNIIAGMIISVATTLMVMADSATTDTISSIVGNITSLIPTYAASQSFLSIVDTSYYNNFCDSIDSSVKDSLCSTLFNFKIDSPFAPCCEEICKLSVYGCFEKKDYLAWDYPSMGMYVMYFCVDTILYFLLLTLIESGIGDMIGRGKYKIMSKFRKEKIISMAKEDMDDDVQREQEEAYRLMDSPDISDTAIVVKDLTKVFTDSGLVAVNKISFHFKKGECFGLLGVNGAGKTTTFRMLTGDEVKTTGDARINNNFLSHGRKRFMEEIGYCPQFDGIIGELTGEEMLSLMAGLRGVPYRMTSKLIDRLVSLVDLTECCKRPCSTYSGGNKRKLSTAMALVGQPPLVFLDEPTSGVDPVSRRKVWEAVRDATSNGQSVILTSHSMDECEALCTKVVIMARGTLRCAGTTQHLKAKFGQGFTVQVKIKSALPEKTEQQYLQLVAHLKENIESEFSGSKLADEHRGMLVYRVPSSHSWSSMFRKLENLKQKAQFKGFIEDYAAMDPSLEQVFLSFAREANEPNRKEMNSKNVVATTL